MGMIKLEHQTQDKQVTLTYAPEGLPGNLRAVGDHRTLSVELKMGGLSFKMNAEQMDELMRVWDAYRGAEVKAQRWDVPF